MSCPKCKNLGIICKKDNDGYELFSHYCDCEIGKAKETGLITYKLSNANIYEKYWKSTLSDLQAQPSEHHAKYIRKIKELATNIPEGYTMVIYGNSGVGKTMGTSLLLKHYLLSTEYSCYYTTMPEMLSQILRDDSVDDELSFFTMLKDVDILVIDDVGLTAIQRTEFPAVTVNSLLRDRISSNKRTFVILTDGKLLENQYKFIAKLVSPNNIYDVIGKNGWISK